MFVCLGFWAHVLREGYTAHVLLCPTGTKAVLYRAASS